MKTGSDAAPRIAAAKAKALKLLGVVGWLLFAAAMVEWKRWSASPDDYQPDLARFKALLPLALLGAVYLWDAIRPRLDSAKTLPHWAWVLLLVAGTLVSLFML